MVQLHLNGRPWPRRCGAIRARKEWVTERADEGLSPRVRHCTQLDCSDAQDGVGVTGGRSSVSVCPPSTFPINGVSRVNFRVTRIVYDVFGCHGMPLTSMSESCI